MPTASRTLWHRGISFAKPCPLLVPSLSFPIGDDLHEIFPTLALDDKKGAVAQIADILACIQGLLPAGVAMFGALTFNGYGQIIDGQKLILPGEPWETYAETWCVNIPTEPDDSEKREIVMLGWKPNGVRNRVEQFSPGGGVGKMLHVISVNQRVLVHDDITAQISVAIRPNEANRHPDLSRFDGRRPLFNSNRQQV